MATMALAAIAGAALAGGLWLVLAPVFANPMLARTNLHGRSVPTAGGLVIVLVGIIGVAALLLDTNLNLDWIPSEATAGIGPMLTAVLGFGLLGLVDDMLGDGSSRGFRGHLTSMFKGQLTTGGLKLFGGGVVALVAVLQARVYPDRLGWLIVDVLVVALAANLANLFDRAPGRVTKFAVISAVALAIAAPTSVALESAIPVPVEWELPPVAAIFVVGAAVGVLAFELREQMMLGDTGANVVGAALGLGVVAGVSATARLVVMIVLLALNLASEQVSFSRVIASTPGLRHLDEWGRAGE